MSIESVVPRPRAVDQEAVGRTIRALRLERNLSQAKLAKELEVDVKTVSRLENGDFLPSLETVVSLARVFQRPLEEVLGLNAVPAEDNTPQREEDVAQSEASVALHSHLKSIEERVAELERLFAEYLELQATHMRTTYRL